MLAPKLKAAVKSDRGQKIERAGVGLEASSSEFSEDDTPLTSRLNLRENSQPKAAGKQLPRYAMAKIAKFVIPRKKKEANDLLQLSSFNSREGKELLRNVAQSYREPALGATFKFEKLELIFNDQLSREFQEKKQNLRNEWRNAKDLEDKHAFLYTTDRQEARKICEMGLEVGSTSTSCLGDPTMGVYLGRHADVVSRKPLVPGSSGFLIVFKVIKGKVKPVTERSGVAVKDLLEPTPNFDCHVSRSIQSLPANTPYFQVFEYSQYYFYEFAEEGDDLHVKRPRQCLPYAVVTFSVGDSAGLLQDSVVQEDSTSTENNEFPEKGGTEKRRNRTRQVVWTGKLANKDRTLASAELLCHSQHKVKLPFDIGEKIVVKEKISFQQLRSLLTFPLFRAGPPSVSRLCKVTLAGDTSYVHCDLHPVNDGHGKIRKLVNYFQERSWAGIVKCPDANRVIFLIPTSQITQDLGITKADSPARLHVLLFKKKGKSFKGREKNSQEMSTVNQIQSELKKKFGNKSSENELSDQRQNDPRRPLADSANSSTQDVPAFETALHVTPEQKKTWQTAVQSWLSRPSPLRSMDAEFHKESQSSYAARDIVTPPASVSSRTRSAEATFSRIHAQDVHVRSDVSSQKARPSARKQVVGLSAVPVIPEVPGMSQHTDAVKSQDVIDFPKSILVRKEEHREDPRLKRHLMREQDGVKVNTPEACRSNLTITLNAREEPKAQGIELDLVATSEVEPSTAASGVSSLKYEVSVDDGVKKAIEEKMKQQQAPQSKYQVCVDDAVRKCLEKNQTQEDSSKTKSGVRDPKLFAKEGKAVTEFAHNNKISTEEFLTKTISSEWLTAKSKENRSRSPQVGKLPKSSSASLGGEKRPKVNENREGGRDGCVEKPQHKRAKVSQHENEDKGAAISRTQEKCTQSNKPVTVERSVPELSEDPLPAIKTQSEHLEASKKPDQVRKKPKLKLILSSKWDVKESDDKNDSFNQIPANKPEQAHSDKSTPSAKRHSQQGDNSKKTRDHHGSLHAERKSIDSPVSMDVSSQSLKTPGESPTPGLPGSVSPISVVSSKGRYHHTPVSPAVPTSAAQPAPGHFQPYSSHLPSTAQFTSPIPQGPFRSALSTVMVDMNNFSSSWSNQAMTLQPSHLMQYGSVMAPGPSIGSISSVPAIPSPISSANVIPPISTAASFSSVSSMPPPMGLYPGAPYPALPPPVPPLPPPLPHSAIQSRKNSLEAASSMAFPLLHPWSPPLPRPGTLPTSTPHFPLPQAAAGFLPIDRARFPSPQEQFRAGFGFGYTQVAGYAPPRGPPFLPPPRPVLPPPVGFAPAPGAMHHIPRSSSLHYQHLPPLPLRHAPYVNHCGMGGFWAAPLVTSTASAVPLTSGIGKVSHSSETPKTCSSSPDKQKHSKQPLSPAIDVNANQSAVKEELKGRDQDLPGEKPQSCDPGKPSASDAAQETVVEVKPHGKTDQLHGDDGDEKKPGVFDAEKSKADVVMPDVGGQERTKTGNDKKPKAEEEQVRLVEPIITGEVGAEIGEVEKPRSCRMSKLELAKDKGEPNASVLVESTSVTQTCDSPGTPAMQGVESMDNLEDSDMWKQQVDVTTPQNESDALTQRVRGPVESTISETENSKSDLSKVQEATELVDQQNVVSCTKESTSNDVSVVDYNSSDDDYVEVDCSVASSSANDYVTEAEQKGSNAVSQIFNILRRNAQSPVASSSINEYVTEAERKGSNAVSKIYNILRRNAQESPSVPCEADRQPEEPLGGSAEQLSDGDSDTDEEGVAKKEAIPLYNKMIEESTDSEQTGESHLDSGLLVVQLVDMGHCDKEKQLLTSVEAEGTEEVHKTAKAHRNKSQAEMSSKESGKDGLHKKKGEIPRDSEWEDISDASDQGTPERDLPGFGGVDLDFTQMWPKVVDTAYQDVTESMVPTRELQELTKPKPEVVRNEADSSSTSPEGPPSRKNLPSQKRKSRWGKHNSGKEVEELSPSSKRRKADYHDEITHRDSSDRGAGSEKPRKVVKGNKGSDEKRKRLKSSSPLERLLNLPSRIVSDAKGGSLQITILQDSLSEEEKPDKENEDAELLGTRRGENPLADIEYSDLEDISPGGLSCNSSERSATPDTPETATPAADFTHPSLGFWAAPLGGNVLTDSVVTEEHLKSNVKGLTATVLPSSLVQPIEMTRPLETGHVHADDAEGVWMAEEPEVAQMSFFCQTTTSEERDYIYSAVPPQQETIGQDEEFIDDIADQYFSQSQDDDEKDNSRYRHDYPQSRVYDYGHGTAADRKQHKESHRSTSHAELKSMGKQHHASTRVSRFPWKTREESKHSQAVSPGGEGPMSASQNATGRSTGCKKPSAHDDRDSSKPLIEKQTLNRELINSQDSDSRKRTASPSSSSSESADPDQTREWGISVFAWMSKTQLESWLQQKQRQAPMDHTGQVLFSPESIRRSSERLFRRVRQRMRRSCHSTRKRLKMEDLISPESVDIDFDDIDLEDSFTEISASHKDNKTVDDDSRMCNLKEVAQVSRCGVTVKSDNSVDKSYSQSTSNEHTLSLCTSALETEVVNSAVCVGEDETVQSNYVEDLICDEEVENILEGGGTKELITCETTDSAPEHEMMGDAQEQSNVTGQSSLHRQDTIPMETRQDLSVAVLEQGATVDVPVMNNKGLDEDHSLLHVGGCREVSEGQGVVAKDQGELAHEDDLSTDDYGHDELGEDAKERQRQETTVGNVEDHQSSLTDVKKALEDEAKKNVLSKTVITGLSQKTNEEESSLTDKEKTAEDLEMANNAINVAKDQGHSLPSGKTTYDEDDTEQGKGTDNGDLSSGGRSLSKSAPAALSIPVCEQTPVTPSRNRENELESNTVQRASSITTQADKEGDHLSVKEMSSPPVVVRNPELSVARNHCQTACDFPVSNEPVVFNFSDNSRIYSSALASPRTYGSAPPSPWTGLRSPAAVAWGVVPRSTHLDTTGTLLSNAPVQQHHPDLHASWRELFPHSPFPATCVHPCVPSTGVGPLGGYSIGENKDVWAGRKQEMMCPPGTELDSSDSVEFNIAGEVKSAQSNHTMTSRSDTQRDNVMEPAQGQLSHDTVVHTPESHDRHDSVVHKRQSHKHHDSVVHKPQSHDPVMDQSVVTALLEFYSEIEEVDLAEAVSENSLQEKEMDIDESETSEVPETSDLPETRTSSRHEELSSVKEVESNVAGARGDASKNMEISGTVIPISESAICLKQPDEADHVNTADCESIEPNDKQSVAVDASVGSTGDVELCDKQSIAVDAPVNSTADDKICDKQSVAVDSPVGSTGDVELCDKQSVAVDAPVSFTADVKICDRQSVAVDAPVNSTADDKICDKQSVAVDSPVGSTGDVELCDKQSVAVDAPVSSTGDVIVVENPGTPTAEGPRDVESRSPIDHTFLAGAEQVIFSSIGSLKDLLGVSSTFDHIAEEAISLTASSLEDVLLQARNRLEGCVSVSSASTEETMVLPSSASNTWSVSQNPVMASNVEHSRGTIQSRDASHHGELSQPDGSRVEWSHKNNNTSKVAGSQQCTQQQPLKAIHRRKFQFFVYSPENDKECEAVKNYMLRAGGTMVDVKDTAFLDENSRELRVLIRKKHLQFVHRLSNLYRLKMMPSVKFAVFNTLTDVTEGRRSYENIFVAGGALIADDTVLKTVEPDHLEALLRFIKEQSAVHQKLVWVMNISRNGYKKLALNRPLTKRDSEVLNLVRRYRDAGFATVLPKGHVSESIPSIQRYLQTSLKLQIELHSLYRHVVLLSDQEKNRMDVSWFVGRGIGVMNIHEFLATFAGGFQPRRLLELQPRGPPTPVKETCTLTDCSTPEDERACMTPDGTPLSDFSDGPGVDACTVRQGSGLKTTLDPSISTERFPTNVADPKKRAVRSLSWDTGAMTQTRLQILSCVRSVRDNIRCQISNSSPSSPVDRPSSPLTTATPLFDAEARLRSQVLEGRGGAVEGPCVASSIQSGQDNLRMD